MCYFNARSVRSNLTALHNLLYSFEYQIICISETWLDDNFINSLLDPDNKYSIYRKDRADGVRGGGVCIFVQRNLNSIPMQDNSVSLNKYTEIVGASITANGHLLNIICVYIAPNISKPLFSSYCNILSHIPSLNKSVVVGDFNHSKVDWKINFFPNDFKSRELFRLCNDGGFTQVNPPSL